MHFTLALVSPKGFIAIWQSLLSHKERVHPDDWDIFSRLSLSVNGHVNGYGGYYNRHLLFSKYLFVSFR
jgi:hypothetical protein